MVVTRALTQKIATRRYTWQSSHKGSHEELITRVVRGRRTKRVSIKFSFGLG